jgi:hypothetical protein
MSAPAPGAKRPRAWAETHLDLLGAASADRTRELDAIVVSSFRPAENLAESMRLAAEVGCRLVVLCSGGASAADVRRVADGVAGLRHAVVEVPPEYDHRVAELRTSSVAETSGGIGDLSTKRNLGLLICHLSDWETVLFLDDDIRALTRDLVEKAVAALPTGGAVGMPAREFPDNSVVCHANRRTGYEQDVFVSGSALVVDCAEITSFFPRIYNEDWMFMAPAVGRGAVTEVGSTRQLAYEPFADPDLAGVQEFGNIVADGLMNLLHRDALEVATRPEYWEEFLPRRKAFIGGIAERTAPEDHVVLAALASAERRRAGISPSELAAYVADWLSDLVTWREAVARLPRGLAFGEVASHLHLGEHMAVSPGFEAHRGTA